MHKCSRDDCPPANISGPTIKCAKCKSVCYLKCFGFEKCATIDGIDVVKVTLPDGSQLFTPVPYSSFVCCTNTLTTTELKAALKIPKANTRSTSKTRAAKPTENANDSPVLNELNEIKKMITKINVSTENNPSELAEIKAMAKESSDKLKSLQNSVFDGPTNGNVHSAVNTPTFANVLGDQRKVMTAKRKLNVNVNDTPNKQRMANLPKPVGGTRDINIGQPLPDTAKANAKPKQMSKPKFDKSLWISKLHFSVTNEEIVDYIMTKTDIKDRNRFNVRKLVKKDADLSLLSHVSFKIDVNEQDFDYLNNPDIWPKTVVIREFIHTPAVKLGAFLDAAMASTEAPATKQPRIEPKNASNETNQGEQQETMETNE